MFVVNSYSTSALSHYLLLLVFVFSFMYLLLWVFLAQMLGYLSAACPSQLGAPLINYLTELETCGAQTLLCVQEFWNVKQKPIYESAFWSFFFEFVCF